MSICAEDGNTMTHMKGDDPESCKHPVCGLAAWLTALQLSLRKSGALSYDGNILR